MAEDCDNPGPEEIRIRQQADEGTPRPGWYIVQIGVALAHGDVLELVEPVLERSRAETGEDARAVLLGDHGDTDGRKWSEVQVRPVQPHDPKDSAFADI